MKDLQSIPLGPAVVKISPYRLTARGKLNAATRRNQFEGVLIEADGGYGCIHPWPELGDPPLLKCLDDLAGPRRWPIVRRALRSAESDRVARRFEHSLFEEMEVPLSHATVVGLQAADIVAAVEHGFGTVKLKCGADLTREAAFLNDMRREFPTLRWRLDFNERLTPDEFCGLMKDLNADTRATLDFIEDPCPYGDESWKKLYQTFRVPLAVDREAAPHRKSAQVMIIKPAVDEPLLLAEAAMANGQKVVVTSAMDHPLGQAFAAWEAARLHLQFPGLVGLCGLQTHHLFEPGAFSEWLGPWSPAFQPPAGLGLGFDDLLDELVWQDWPRK